MAEIKNLRREAGRLRQKAGIPIPQVTLDGLSITDIRWIISDTRKTIRDQSEKEAVRIALDSLLDWPPEDAAVPH